MTCSPRNAAVPQEPAHRHRPGDQDESQPGPRGEGRQHHTGNRLRPCGAQGRRGFLKIAAKILQHGLHSAHYEGQPVQAPPAKKSGGGTKIVVIIAIVLILIAVAVALFLVLGRAK